MFKNPLVSKGMSLFSMFSLVTLFSMVTLAVDSVSTGDLTVTGQVTINGVATRVNTTLVSGSMVTVDQGSAVLSLGRSGKVELTSGTSARLTFTGSDVVAVLSSGKMRVLTTSGVASTVTTNHGTFVGDFAKENSYMVEVECGHSHVDTMAGAVAMKTGAASREVVAGASAVAGNVAQAGCKPCYRPESPIPTATPKGFMTVLLLAGGAIGTAFIVGARQTGDTTGPVVVVSPIR